MIFTCKDLCVSYENKIVLQNLNFSIEKGSFFGIIGANGCGKSTLLNALLGLKNINSGEIIIEQSIKKQGFGYLAQKIPAHKNFPASVNEVIMSGLLSKKGIKAFFNANDKKIAAEKIALLGIEHLKNRKFEELSGGEQKKCLLARALCVNEDILIMDEPSSNLDEKSRTNLYDIIRTMHRKGSTIIMVSHDINYIKHNATSILNLSKEN